MTPWTHSPLGWVYRSAIASPCAASSPTGRKSISNIDTPRLKPRPAERFRLGSRPVVGVVVLVRRAARPAAMRGGRARRAAPRRCDLRRGPPLQRAAIALGQGSGAGAGRLPVGLDLLGVRAGLRRTRGKPQQPSWRLDDRVLGAERVGLHNFLGNGRVLRRLPNTTPGFGRFHLSDFHFGPLRPTKRWKDGPRPCRDRSARRPGFWAAVYSSEERVPEGAPCGHTVLATGSIRVPVGCQSRPLTTGYSRFQPVERQPPHPAPARRIPAVQARGAHRNRTGVNGFAGRCVATPPGRQAD